jgi:Peptidase propeptide and YPEB domain
MDNRKQSMRLGLVVLIGVSIMLAGWLATGSVAQADRDGRGGGHKLRAMADRIADAKLTLVQAIQAAEKTTGGVAVEAEYELEDNGLEIEVDVLVGEKIKEVEFDAMTGKQLKDDDDEHKGRDDDDDDDNNGRGDDD